MKKSINKWILAATTLVSLTANAAMNGDASVPQAKSAVGNYQDSQKMNQNWHELLMQKEGWIECGVDVLIMSSTIRPIYSDEQLLLDSVPAPDTVNLNKRVTGSMNPDYNVGFAANLRYRPPGNNDIGAYYKYIRNNGGGSFKERVVSNTSFPVNGSTDNAQDDRGSYHIHSHIVDVLFGRTYPLADHFLIRLDGGMNYTDIHYSSIVHDNDDVFLFNADGSIFTRQKFTVNADQNNRFWGIGPKLGIDFEYYFLPNSWKHDLNFYLLNEFALLYMKEWSNGTLFSDNLFTNSLGVTTFTESNAKWYNKPKYELIPNINIDVGLKYRYHTSSNVILNFAIGYKVLSYWNFEELNRSRFFQGGEDGFFFLGNAFDDHFMYSGAYAHFSVAY